MDGACLSAGQGPSWVRQASPPPARGWRGSSVSDVGAEVTNVAARGRWGRPFSGPSPTAGCASRTTKSLGQAPCGRRRPARPQAVFSRGVTSFLLLPLLPLLGRTGLLADLLPSFAVEIMPGIQSFNSSFA